MPIIIDEETGIKQEICLFDRCNGDCDNCIFDTGIDELMTVAEFIAKYEQN